eukprot:scaffold1060_cov196-Amphora_coffeaeformis.AAC.1
MCCCTSLWVGRPTPGACPGYCPIIMYPGTIQLQKPRRWPSAAVKDESIKSAFSSFSFKEGGSLPTRRRA